MMRKSLQPDLIAEAFSFVSFTVQVLEAVIARATSEGSCLLFLWQKYSKQENATAKQICLLGIVVFNSFFWLLFTAISYGYLLMRRVLTSE